MALRKSPKICKEFTSRSVEFLQSRQITDCIFFVGSSPDHQQTITAHKLILAGTSPVFEKMLYGSWAEEIHQIPIPDMNPEDFKEFLNYIYTSKVNLKSIEQAIGVYYGANKYELPYLKDICSNYLESNLGPSNAFIVYEAAKLFDNINLINKATKIFMDKTRLVLEETNFEEMDLATLVYIFSLRRLNIDNEMDLFKAALRYEKAQENGTNHKMDTDEEQDKKMTVNSAVENIRFLTLTPKEFAEESIDSNLLSKSEKFSILMNISSTNTTEPYPSRLSKNRQQRNKITSITFKLEDIKNLKQKVYSSPVFIQNSLWKLLVSPEQDADSVEYLGVYLHSNAASEIEGWNCNAKCELRLCSQKEGSEDIRELMEHNFTKKEKCWGFNTFIEWDELFDPELGFIKDGAIILEADIDAEIPKVKRGWL